MSRTMSILALKHKPCIKNVKEYYSWKTNEKNMNRKKINTRVLLKNSKSWDFVL